MNAKSAFAFVALLGSIGGATFIVSPAQAVDASAFRAQGVACAGGYHLDGNGNCQPNSGYTNTGCQPGYMSEPFPNTSGYRCVPIPASYSQYFR